MNELEVVKMIVQGKCTALSMMGSRLGLEGHEWEKLYERMNGYYDAISVIDEVAAKFKESRDSETEALNNLLEKAIPLEDLIADADDGIIDDCFLDRDEECNCEVCRSLREARAYDDFYKRIGKQATKAFTSNGNSHDVTHTDHDEPDDVRA